MTTAPEISLLWPNGIETPTWPIPPDVIRDLELAAIVRAICSHSRYQRAITDVFYRLCLDEATIRYRQSIVQDLQSQPEFVVSLRELLPLLEELSQHNFRHLGRGDALQAVLVRARELELLVVSVQQLEAAFASAKAPFTTGLEALRTTISLLAEDEQFLGLAAELPDLLAALRSNASLTVGINLDHNLRPEAAVLLAVNQERFQESGLLDRLLGKGSSAGQGIAPLHRPPVVGSGANGPKRLDAKMVPLFQDLARILERISEPIARELKKYAQLNGQFLARLHGELVFYLESLRLIERLTATGLPLSYPELLPLAERQATVVGSFNLQLALREMENSAGADVVYNDISLGQKGRIAILTGPNQGGKTTYMQSIGLVQVLAQLGLPVPGQSAAVSLVDAIYTHYPTEEKLALGTGRFGDEAQRLRTIFEKITSDSLVLLNESLATTGMQEGLQVARDIVIAFRQIGVRAVFTTHLYELAEQVEAINRATPGESDLFSLVASRPTIGLSENQLHTYHIEAGPPLGRSYAEHIATRYGIAGDQLQALLARRKLLPTPPEA